jgi:hypothetical protein
MSEKLTKATPEMYARVFENHAEGKIVFEDLVARFGGNPYVKGGHEGDRETAFNAGSLKVISFVVGRINQAALGIEENEV